MGITVLHARPDIVWDRIAAALSVHFQRDPRDLVHVIDVQRIGQQEISFIGDNLLIIGTLGMWFFQHRGPVGYRIKQLDYGQSRPQLFIIDSVNGFGGFTVALVYDESCTGMEAYHACGFLLSNIPLRDRLIVHQTARFLVPHESGIFSIPEDQIHPPPGRRHSYKVSRLAGQRPPPFGRIQEAPEGPLPF